MKTRSMSGTTEATHTLSSQATPRTKSALSRAREAKERRPPPTATRSELAQRTWFVIVCVSTCETPSIFLSFSRNSASGGWPASSHGPKVSSGTWSGLGLELGACGVSTSFLRFALSAGKMSVRSGRERRPSWRA